MNLSWIRRLTRDCRSSLASGDSSRRRQETALIFDKRTRYGTRECFFHFIWGYLLPSMHLIENDKSREKRYLFASCGPVMDRLLKEAMELIRCDFKIIPKNPNRLRCNRILIPRWDIFLLRPLLLGPLNTTHERIHAMQKKTRGNPTLQKQIESDSFAREFTSSVFTTKSLIEARISTRPINPRLAHYSNTYLILSRSPENLHYAPTKKQPNKPGYGLSKRSLTGLDEARSILLEKGIPIEIFEPGRYSLVEQIQVFRSCKGIVGIKGAEFANLIWLPSGSRVILIKPSCMNTLPVQQCLARMLGLDYLEIETREGKFPELNPDLLLPLLQKP